MQKINDEIYIGNSGKMLKDLLNLGSYELLGTDSKRAIKFENGLLIQVVKTSLSNSSSSGGAMSQNGNIYRKGKNLDDFYMPFVTKYGQVSQMSTYNNNYMWLGNFTTGSNTNAGTCDIVAGQNNSSWSLQVTTIAIGTWK